MNSIFWLVNLLYHTVSCWKKPENGEILTLEHKSQVWNINNIIIHSWGSMVSRISMYVRIFYNNWLLLGQKYRSLKTKIDYKSIILDQRHVRHVRNIPHRHFTLTFILFSIFYLEYYYIMSSLPSSPSNPSHSLHCSLPLKFTAYFSLTIIVTYTYRYTNI